MKLTAFLMGEESRGLVSFQNFKPKNVFLFNNNLKLIVPVLLQITNPGYSNCRRVSLAKDALFEMDCNLPNIRQFFFFFFFFFLKFSQVSFLKCAGTDHGLFLSRIQNIL